MPSVAKINLWGSTIGAVSLDETSDVTAFAYDPAFAESGIEIAPLMMPLSTRTYSFPGLSRETYHGLPGLLSDSLPDKFGNALIDSWLATQGREPGSFNALERLCYTGARGMGALEFEPATGPRDGKSTRLEVDELVRLASLVLAHRHDLKASLSGQESEHALKAILRVGTSAGGARAKAVIAWNPSTHELRSGQVPASEGFEHWLLKFDGVKGNTDKEIGEPQGYGVIEYAYSRMAADAGIQMSECRLLEENGRRHFMTRRFDRPSGHEKLHMQSLCALAHYDFNMAGAYSYEQALMVIRQLNLPMSAVEQQFRRMAFNIIARNQDDHVKNVAFLMDKAGQWSLAPAFDLTYSYDPVNIWMASHQMSMNGKRDGFSRDDLNACAKTISMKRGRAEAIVHEVIEVVSRWRDYADAAGVVASSRDKIQNALRILCRPASLK
jgi:serine/threonine-protein kinase HipA